MPQRSIAAVRQAIAEKKNLACSYRGFLRDLCPHAMGWKDGQRHVLAFQFGGESSTGLRPGGDWQCIPVGQMRDIVLRDGPWRTAPDYGRLLACFDVVDVSVEI